MEQGDDLNDVERAILALLYSPAATLQPGVPVSGKTRLMKLLFLLSQEMKSPLVPPELFRAHKYGPFSHEVEAALDELRFQHLVSLGNGPPYVITLTPEGMASAKAIWLKLDEHEKRRIFGVKAQFNALPIMKLLHYVYSRYPGAAAASEIREEVLD